MGGEPVLRSIDLDVSPGRVVVLRGSNGAGKTTLLKVLATRLRPSSGGGAVFGNDLVRQANEVRASVGFLGAYGSNYPMLTARENLVLATSLSSYPALGAGAGAAPDRAAIDAEQAAIARLQAAQQQRVITQLLAERELLDTAQRERLLQLLLGRYAQEATEEELLHRK